MKIKAALFALLLLPSCAVLDKVNQFHCPKKYAHRPHGEVSIRYASAEEVRQSCFAGHSRACSYTFKDDHSCHIVMRDNEPPMWHKYILDHEMCHCRGWPPDHSH